MQRRIIRRCAGCGQPHYLPAWRDPRWCYRCAVLCAPWRPVIFGRIRKVPPQIAARWEEPEQAIAA